MVIGCLILLHWWLIEIPAANSFMLHKTVCCMFCNCIVILVQAIKYCFVFFKLFVYLNWQCIMHCISSYTYIWGRNILESWWLVSLYPQQFLVIQLHTIFQVTAECFCKENVYGQACDLCKDGTFNIQEKNDEGCSKCFCFSRTTRCSSSALYKDKVKLFFIYK